MHVSMYCEPFGEGNAVNTGGPCPKVPMYRKLGQDKAEQTLDLESTRSRHGPVARLGIWTTGQGDLKVDGRSLGQMGRENVLHRQVGDVYCGHPARQARAKQDDDS